MKLPDILKRKNDDREAQRYATLMYRNVFLESPNGRLVLNSMLQSCGLLRVVENEEQRILHNWGVYLLSNLGLDIATVKGVVDYNDLIDSLAKIRPGDV
jgi:hypothetical protein